MFRKSGHNFSASNTRQLIDLEPAICVKSHKALRDGKMTQAPPLPPRTLILDNLAGQRGEKLLFEAISLTLGPGQAAELRGPNGAGKTTLLMIVAGVVRPAAGSVHIEGGDPEARPETD